MKVSDRIPPGGTAAASAIGGFNVYAAGVLLLLFLANLLNFVDRLLFAILQEAIKEDLSLTDFQLGLLGGPAFALLFAAATLPISRVADRGHSVKVISACLAAWSVMTGLCGLATNFFHLLLGRMGVSIGEAGCQPAANALISSYFPTRERGRAIAILSSAGPLGALTATVAGAALAQAFGWRGAFLVCGVVGVVFASVLLIIREPKTAESKSSPVRFLGAMKLIFARRTMVHVCAGMVFATMSSYSIIHYLTSFLIRAHGLELKAAAGITGLIVGVFGAAGMFAGGYIVDRSKARFPRIQVHLPAVCLVTAPAFFAFAFMTPTIALALPALILAGVATSFHTSAGFLTVQDVTPLGSRATATAVMLMAVGVISIALGPPLVGLTSDLVAQSMLAGTGLDLRACASSPNNQTCSPALVNGLRWGLLVISAPYLLGAIHFWIAGRTLEKDRVAD